MDNGWSASLCTEVGVSIVEVQGNIEDVCDLLVALHSNLQAKLVESHY